MLGYSQAIDNHCLFRTGIESGGFYDIGITDFVSLIADMFQPRRPMVVINCIRMLLPKENLINIQRPRLSRIC
jgi:hypothetical protein